MKAILKTLGAACTGVMLATTAVHADTIVAVTETHYDANLRPDCVATRMEPSTFGNAPANACNLVTTAGTYGPDRITKTVYDAAGQATQVIQAYGTSVQRTYSTMVYSNNGLVTDQIDANGNRTHMVYDGFDSLVTYNYPSTTRPSAFNPSTQATALSTAGAYSTTDYEAYDYDANGNKTYTRRRDGQVINDCYDTLNRSVVHYVHAQSGCTATGGATDVYTTYDLQSHIITKRFASTAGAGIIYYYDGLGRMNSTTDMNGRSIWLGYVRPDNVRTVVVWPDGLGMNSDNRDALGRIKTANFGGLGTIFTQTYDDLGRRTQLNRGAGAAITNYTYDAFGRLSTFNDDVSGTANDITWTFSARNPANQIVTWGASSTVYDYKETTNTTVNQTYDGLNRDAAIAAVSGGYDARGNLTKDATRTMTYDVENRLLTTVGTGVNVAMVYDPEGRLAKYSTDGGTTYTTFLYEGTALIGEYNNAGTLLRRYIHGDGVDEPIVWFEGAGTTDRRYLMPNYQGSIIGYTDAAGTLATVYKYGPYGEPKDISNNDSWSGARFRYTGQTMLPEARLYYYKARVYDPIYGHFMQTDPIGADDDLDMYAYTGNDPVNRADPDGQQSGVNIAAAEGEGIGAKLAQEQAAARAATERAAVAEGRAVAGARVAQTRPAVPSSVATPAPVSGPGQWKSVNESMSAGARAYQTAVTGRSDQAYVVNGTKFDGYNASTRTLVDAKGSYGSLVVNGSFRFSTTAADIWAQAIRQTLAVGATGENYNIVWKVQDQSTASAIREVFKQNDITNIRIQVVPK